MVLGGCVIERCSSAGEHPAARLALPAPANPLPAFPAHTQIDTKANVCTVRWRPGSAHELALGSADHGVYLYDTRRTDAPVATFRGHRWVWAGGGELGPGLQAWAGLGAHTLPPADLNGKAAITACIPHPWCSRRWCLCASSHPSPCLLLAAPMAVPQEGCFIRSVLRLGRAGVRLH